ELARLKVPLVRLRGQWVELDDAHLKAALKFLERNQAGTMTAADALTAGMGLRLEGTGAGGPDEEIPLVGVDADGWLGDLLSGQVDHRVHVHHGADRLDGESLVSALAGADLVITTYGVATRDQAALSQVTWARVVCDEAQNIKNHATRQARAVRALPAAARIALTGTPVENRLSELWSIMDFTNPGLLGPAERFRERYAVPIER